jgi:hypothetical protein
MAVRTKILKKRWTEDENPKEKVKFLKGGEFLKGGAIPRISSPPPGGGDIPRNFAPRGRNCGGAKSWDTGIHDKRVRKILYLTVVRSQLAYSSQVWAPQTVNNILTIERLQRRAWKFIFSLPYKTSIISYKKRLATIGILPLCYWHKYLDMVDLHKCLRPINNSDNNISIKIPTRETRNTSSTKGILLFFDRSISRRSRAVGSSYFNIFGSVHAMKTEIPPFDSEIKDSTNSSL